MNGPSISFEDLLAWEREHADAAAQVVNLQGKVDGLRRKIDAARILFSDADSLPASTRQGLSVTAETLVTWRDLVLFALSRAKGGRTQAQMLEAGRETAMADRVKRSPNSLYVKVKAMESREEIVRDGQHFYLPDVWDAIQRGEMEDDKQEVALNAGSIQQTVLSLMRDGKPRRAREIEEFLKNNPATARQVRLSPAYVSTLLSRMFRNERLDKLEDGVYVFRNENEPPVQTDGPDAGGADTPLFENVTRFPGVR